MPQKTLEARRAYQQTYRIDHVSEFKQRNGSYYAQNKQKLNQKHRQYVRNLKVEVKKLLGGKCACCGEEEFEFLNVDHVNNDGSVERHGRKTRPNLHYYLEIKKCMKEGTPVTRYQLLCCNCNYSKHLGNGTCVHKRNPEMEVN